LERVYFVDAIEDGRDMAEQRMRWRRQPIKGRKK